MRHKPANPPRSPVRILRIDASARQQASVTRQLEDGLIKRLQTHYGEVEVKTRDAAQRARLALSDELVDELYAADVLVVGVPVYNFGIPAALKAWIDLVARVQRTFRYTEEGPEGLLGGRKAYMVLASGGVPAGSEVDFASSYMRHVLGFLGITDVALIAADSMALDGEAALQRAYAEIAAVDPQREAAA